jgi:hypothetical protein
LRAELISCAKDLQIDQVCSQCGRSLHVKAADRRRRRGG